MLKSPIFILLCIVLILGCSHEPVSKSQDKKNIPMADMTITADQAKQVDNSDFSALVSSYENEDRQYWQKPQLVINSLGDLTNKVVADIGAGTGYFTLRMLPKAKKVIAIDIDKRMTDFVESLKAELDDEFSKKLEVRLGEPNDPKLVDREADIIFLANTYPYIENRIDYFKALHSKLNENGKLVIVDYKKKIIPVHPVQDERLALYQVEQELIQAGYILVNSDDLSLPYQYIIEAKADPR
jgi:SAM-dependent methyltransferase